MQFQATSDMPVTAGTSNDLAVIIDGTYKKGRKPLFLFPGFTNERAGQAVLTGCSSAVISCLCQLPGYASGHLLR